MNKQHAIPCDRSQVTGVVLAGGQGSRLEGRDKGLIELDGSLLIQRVLDALTPQVGAVLINANRNQPTYQQLGHPVIVDTLGGFAGPLAGMLSAMRAAQTPYIMTVPCDAPGISEDLRHRLCTARDANDSRVAVAQACSRLQPVFALLHVSLADELEAWLVRGERKAGLWFRQQNAAIADFSDCPACFENINTRTDLQRLGQAC